MQSQGSTLSKMEIQEAYKRPNFFIIGAPKCGTTSIAAWLSQHPDVFISKPKEPHFFNSDMKSRRYRKASSYRRLFNNASEGTIAIGEASTWYLYSDVAVPNILDWNPEARFIVMVRNPAAMALSLFLHNHRHGHENAATFEEAWRLQHQRKQGKKIPRLCADPHYLMYKEACALGSQVERLLNWAPSEQICILGLQNLKNDPKGCLYRIEHFLGLEHHSYSSLKAQNESSRVRSRTLLYLIRAAGRLKRSLGIRQQFGLAQLNERKAEKPILPKQFKEELDREFEAEREKLNRLTPSTESAL